MLVSLKEVGKYVDLSNLTAEEIASKLTNSGIEVEEIKTKASATNLVIGQVISCLPHKDSDHLHVCKVDIKDEILDIVCGAPNVRVGLKVIVAKVGAKLPLGEIKAGLIRGEASNGMLCSLNELGVDPKTLTEKQINGIEELDEDAEVGNEHVLEYLGLDDKILDLKLLANRSDCLSLYNVAKEIGALFNREVNIPIYKDNSNYIDEFKVGSTSQNSKSFRAKIFKNVKIGPSPKWLSSVLSSEGIRSINSIVDIGNYVMLLTGHPVHMYDMDKLPANELIVKDDLDLSVIALDEKEYKLEKGDLVVTSNNAPVCIGGVMGLKNVEVDENSTNIVLEVASFYGARVRKTSTRLGLSSDSSSRYVKGINLDNEDEVVLLASNLIEELCSPEKISSTFIYDENIHEKKAIKCSKDYINNRLSTSFTLNEIVDVLSSLNFICTKENDNDFEVEVPSYRLDVTTKADLSEEVIRVKGFEYIKESLPLMETTVGGRSLEATKMNNIRSYLLNYGLNEILSYTLINKVDNESFNYLSKEEGYVVLNPLTEDHKFVRQNLLSSMVNTVEYNLAHLNRNFGLFEISNSETKKTHSKHLCIALSGAKKGIELYESRQYDVLDAKGIFENILSLLNISPSRIRYERLSNSLEFHPYRSMNAYLDNKLVAVLGEIHPKMKEKFNFNKDSLVLLEADLTKLVLTKTGNNKFVEYSRFPSVSRDYAFILDSTISYSSIVKELKRCSSLIKNIELFDVYSGNHVEEGKKSIALTVTFVKDDSTFSNEEIQNLNDKIIDTIKNKIKGTIRE